MSLATLILPSVDIKLRRATLDDLDAVIALLAADRLRASDDSTSAARCAADERAFQLINSDPAQLLVVGINGALQVVSTLLLTVIPGLARAGSLRMQVEAVRVDEGLRGRGVGTAMMAWVLDEARRRYPALVQVTSDPSRHSDHRFYRRLGFTASHVGFTLRLGVSG